CRGLSFRSQVVSPAAASSARRAARGADAAASSFGADRCREITSSLGWSCNPFGSTTSLNLARSRSASSPQVSSASPRPRVSPPPPVAADFAPREALSFALALPFAFGLAVPRFATRAFFPEVRKLLVFTLQEIVELIEHLLPFGSLAREPQLSVLRQPRELVL